MKLYQRSLEIERRLDQMLWLIRTGRHSTPTLAKAVGVSIPTISRCVTALRERGARHQGPEGCRRLAVRSSPTRRRDGVRTERDNFRLSGRRPIPMAALDDITVEAVEGMPACPSTAVGVRVCGPAQTASEAA